MNISELQTIPAGSYSARAGGYISSFDVNGQNYKAKFLVGVRGINIADTVTVSQDGSIRSTVLGKDGKIQPS